MAIQRHFHPNMISLDTNPFVSQKEFSVDSSSFLTYCLSWYGMFCLKFSNCLQPPFPVGWFANLNHGNAIQRLGNDGFKLILNKHFWIPYPCHHNLLLIINCSWILTIRKERQKFMNKSSLKNVFGLPKWHKKYTNSKLYWSEYSATCVRLRWLANGAIWVYRVLYYLSLLTIWQMRCWIFLSTFIFM